ncbi:hypothetical protein ACWEJP_01205 [Streptomyces sp. NPDC004749]
MEGRQLPAETVEFARYLRELTARLDQGGGWYGVFVRRDPDGLRACLDGADVPPWDVVESLLHDLTAGGDARAHAREAVRARALHTASAAAYDRRPGGAESLSERLRLMTGEQARAAGRAEELIRLMRAAPEGSPRAEQLAGDLAWVRDDHARAAARCAELRERWAALAARGRTDGTGAAGRADAVPDRSPGGSSRPAGDERHRADGGRTGAHRGTAGQEGAGWGDADRAGVNRTGVDQADAGRAGVDRTGVDQDGAGRSGADRTGARAPVMPGGPGEQTVDTTASRKNKRATAARRRPRGARFAGLDLDDTAEPGIDEAPPVPLPVAPVAPRGARFGGSAGPPVERVPRDRAQAHPHAPEDLRAAAETVATLVRLRADGRTGEAHIVLCEAAGRPAGQLPPLAAELHRAGLDADWSEVLWEAASLPPVQLAAAAGALAGAGRDADCRHLLRQGVSRPAEEIAGAALALGEAGRAREARALLTAFVQARTPKDAALVAALDPRTLVPQLIDAARAVSVSRERDLVHALRMAGIAPA